MNLIKQNPDLENKNGKYLAILTGVIILLVLLIWIIPIKDDISISIEYSREFDNNFGAQVFWRDSEDFSEEKSSYGIVKNNKVELPIGERIEEIQELRLDPTNVCQDMAITSIQIKNHGIGMEILPMREVFNKSGFYAMAPPKLNLSVLYMKPLDNDPMIVLGKDLIIDYFGEHTFKYKIVVSVWLMLAGVLFAVVMYTAPYSVVYIKKIYRFIYQRYDIILRIILVSAVLLVIYMAFNSFDYAHPDENMSKAAVEYYIDHWTPADIRSEAAADSFSTYGHSRLSETTVYYFFAGKIAWIARNVFGLQKYYRAFNVLLFVIMAVIFYKKGKKNPWLYLMLGLTPQIWYIFSYTTSDAWDYFLSFLILHQLTAADSIFRRAMDAGFTKKTIISLLIIGIVYGALLLGKKNYYFIFVASFLFLLYQLFADYKNNLMQIVMKYGIIIAVCLLLFSTISYIDMRRYEGNKAEILQEQREKYVSEAYNSNIQSVSQANRSGIRMKEQGIGLKGVLNEYGFLKYSYQSFAGKYGWMEYESSNWYYIISGILYGTGIILLVSIMIASKLWPQRILFCLLIGLNIAIFAASLWHSWTSDFQPQGRYLFAMNYNIALCSFLFKEFFNKKGARLITCALGGFAIYSFIANGIINLT